jgi:hypothetical protein
MRDDDEMRDKDAAGSGRSLTASLGFAASEHSPPTRSSSVSIRKKTPGAASTSGSIHRGLCMRGTGRSRHRRITTRAISQRGANCSNHWIQRCWKPGTRTTVVGASSSFRTDTVLSCRMSLSHGWRTPGTSTGMWPSQPLPRLDSPFLTRRLTKRPPRQGHGSTLGRSPEGRASIPAGSDNGPPSPGALTGQRIRRESLRSARTLPPV